MGELQVFSNAEFGSVRSLMVNGEPYFVGKDVAEILGYKDTADALRRHVDDEDKLTRCFTDSGQGREMYIINEFALYSLILSSKLPAAKRFKKWATKGISFCHGSQSPVWSRFLSEEPKETFKLRRNSCDPA